MYVISRIINRKTKCPSVRGRNEKWNATRLYDNYTAVIADERAGSSFPPRGLTLYCCCPLGALTHTVCSEFPAQKYKKKIKCNMSFVRLSFNKPHRGNTEFRRKICVAQYWLRKYHERLQSHLLNISMNRHWKCVLFFLGGGGARQRPPHSF